MTSRSQQKRESLIMNINEELRSTTKPLLVPFIGDDKLADMRSCIEPLLQVPETHWYQRIENAKNIDPRGVSYIWDAKPIGEKLAFGLPVTIMSFHKWGAPALFKPSLAEVYASIDRFISDWTRVKFFCLRSGNMGTEHIIGDCHWCYCDLFGEAINGNARPL